ncbi:ABC transporter ATP-binding protein [Rhizobium sp. PL01]|uniref:ABC transporter ATP-binding protein n=1 Tax=Rhizobium sp. PL01 TaxID=3085631 RepID=UPI0029821053|nr:ATP-binding cassette domain-containing protein [Rhizobium sp. PL01]MDW5315738.1 ATP-binding cassette domain-containing protein [Rhizobium sp. PL01]
MLSLDLNQISVSYPGLPSPVLDIPSLSVGAGSRVAVTGASGSGKSTLVNILTGLERCAGGYIRWGGTDIAAMSERSRDRWRGAHIGLVMQDFHLFPGLSAVDNILLPARLSRAMQPGDPDRALMLLYAVGLCRADQKIETMSRGEMQRVAIARALLRRPGVLIADEPTASLDSESGDAVARLLIDLSVSNESTLIVVSHDPRLTGQLDRRITLSAGRIASDRGHREKAA